MSNETSRSERLLRDAINAAALPHRLALLDIEAQHRLAWYRSHYNPDEPRVPKGNPRGGQWTREGGVSGTQIAAAEKPPRGPSLLPAILLRLAAEIIEAYRKKKGLRDLFGHKLGTVAWTSFKGQDIFGSNSDSPTYTSDDWKAAVRLRTALIEKYPDVMKTDNVGRIPNNAVFHAEATVLLRAARENGGSLAGETLVVHSDREMCPSCKVVLPKIGVELGNPTVTFIDQNGLIMIMRNGSWE